MVAMLTKCTGTCAVRAVELVGRGVKSMRPSPSQGRVQVVGSALGRKYSVKITGTVVVLLMAGAAAMEVPSLPVKPKLVVSVGGDTRFTDRVWPLAGCPVPPAGPGQTMRMVALAV